MNKLILSLLIVTITSVAWAQPPNPVVDDNKSYAELKVQLEDINKEIKRLNTEFEDIRKTLDKYNDKIELLDRVVGTNKLTPKEKSAYVKPRRKPIELGDVVLYLPRKMLADVIKIDRLEGKKVYKLKPISNKDIEYISAVEKDIWDGNVVWMQMGSEKIMPEFINDSDGTLIYGDKAKWDSMPDAFKELPPVKEKKPEPDPRRRGRFSGRAR